MTIVFVIVTYNGSRWIENCLQSIPLSGNHKVIVVDNASTDNTREIIDSGFPSVDLLPSHDNLGFGRANNLAVRHALGKYEPDGFFLLNQDARLGEDCLEKMVAEFQKGQYDILSPVHLNGEGTDFDHGFAFHLEKYGIDPKSMEEAREVPFVNAAAWLVSPKVFRKIGGFDPLFRHYGEDDNLVYRIQYHGMKLGVMPGAIVYHDRSPASDQEFDPKVEWRLYLARATNPSIGLWGENTRSLRKWSRTRYFVRLAVKMLSWTSRIKRSRRYAKSPPFDYLYIQNKSE